MIRIPGEQYCISAIDHRADIQSGRGDKPALVGLRWNVRRKRRDSRDERRIIEMSSLVIAKQISARLDSIDEAHAILNRAALNKRRQGRPRESIQSKGLSLVRLERSELVNAALNNQSELAQRPV